MQQHSTNNDGLSRATALRLSYYLRSLENWQEDGAHVSSRQIAQCVDVSDAQVRRDLANLGKLGQRGIGYVVDDLSNAIRRALGIHREWRAIVVGIGNLARALLRYEGFKTHGFRIVGLFDSDDQKIGQTVETLPVEPASSVEHRVRELDASLAILTVPVDVAQDVANAVTCAGVRGILNFAPVILRLEPHVKLVSVDLAIQLEQLAFLVQHGSTITQSETINPIP